MEKEAELVTSPWQRSWGLGLTGHNLTLHSAWPDLGRGPLASVNAASSATYGGRLALLPHGAAVRTCKQQASCTQHGALQWGCPCDARPGCVLALG